jgi:hypothetical protein
MIREVFFTQPPGPAAAAPKKAHPQKASALLLTFVFYLLSSLPLHAQFVQEVTDYITPFEMPAARYTALGGMHPAHYDDFYMLFVNPAGFANVRDSYSYAEISADIHAFDLPTITSLSDGTLDATQVFGTIWEAADVGGPISAGFIGNNWGLGVFNVTRFKTTAGNPPTANKNLYLGEELFATSGYGWRIHEYDDITFDFGFTAKLFFRGVYENSLPVSDINTFYDHLDDMFFQTQLGFGVDIGVTLTFGRRFSWALTIADIGSFALVSLYDSFGDFLASNPGKIGVSQVERRINIGAAYRLGEPYQFRNITDIVFMLTYGGLSENFSNDPRNPILDLRIGFEIFLLDVFHFRLGFADMQPAAGFGFDFRAFTLDLAFRFEEMGYTPSDTGASAMSAAIGILFRYRRSSPGGSPPEFL